MENVVLPGVREARLLSMQSVAGNLILPDSGKSNHVPHFVTTRQNPGLRPVFPNLDTQSFAPQDATAPTSTQDSVQDTHFGLTPKSSDLDGVTPSAQLGSAPCDQPLRCRITKTPGDSNISL